jgi:hypothetical protein
LQLKKDYCMILVGWKLNEKALSRLRRDSDFCFLQAYASKLSTLSKKKSPSTVADGLFRLSGWQDSNLRPSGPKPDALTGLRYTPLCPL